MEDSQPKVKAFTLKELAIQYQCSAKTLKKWLQKIQPELGPRIGHFYNPKQVQTIFDKIGVPFVFLMAAFMKMIGADVIDHDQDNHPSDDAQSDHNGQGNTGYTYDDIQKYPWRNWRRD